MSSRPRVLGSILATLLCLGTSAGCVILGTSNNDPNAVFTLTTPPPSGASFKPVGLFIEQRCGTLDCHGQVGRNMRLYGKQGMRLDPTQSTGGTQTTAAELDADYQAIVSLEPEVMNEVVGTAEANPSQLDPTVLTFYRKPTGLEHHKGGQLIQPPTATTPGDDQDTCIRYWLAGQVTTSTFTTACANAANYALYP